MTMTISLIVAMAENNVIGKDNHLIWHLPVDLKFFKEKTSGHCIITGRKNYESIPEKFRPLTNRTNIVVSRGEKNVADESIWVKSIEEAIELAKQKGENELFIIGGAEIYRQTIGITDKIYMTKIHHSFEGDVYFPELKITDWRETEKRKGIVDEKNIYPHDFIIYER